MRLGGGCGDTEGGGDGNMRLALGGGRIEAKGGGQGGVGLGGGAVVKPRLHLECVHLKLPLHAISKLQSSFQRWQACGSNSRNRGSRWQEHQRVLQIFALWCICGGEW